MRSLANDIFGADEEAEVATLGSWDARRRVIRESIKNLLVAIGEDGTREGLVDTPDRVARFWEEWLTYEAGNHDVTFVAANTDELVAVRGMRLWSMCEHHLLPFEMEVAVGYLSEGKVIGLSKIARLAQRHAHRLTMQERFAQDTATDLQKVVGASVAVVARGEHTCLAMRGVRTPGVMHTSVMLGRFREKDALRAEFLALVG